MLSDLREAYQLEPKKVQLSHGFKKDLAWWESAMDKHNGVSIIDHQRKMVKITMDGSTKGEVDG